MRKVFEMLKERGYVYQATNEEKIKEMLNSDEPKTFYLGIDPTADSLHIGHFFALTMVRRLQKLGHHPIILIGGATALIGDPSGKKDMRKMLSKEQVEHNKAEVKELVKRFVDVDGDNPALILDNSEWINPQSYIDFMRNIGVHFNVNKMLATDCYKNRLEEGGLTFLEMGYMLMQAFDFVHLNETYGCVLEIGGSDQWANMVAGADLARKIDFANGKEDRGLQALTCPLLIKADGEKMGKTASGTLWISREKTTVYDFYQMFMNSYDEDVERLLSFFSDYEIEDIKRMCKEDIRNAKKIMAFEVTKLVHGEEEALKVQQASEEIFSNKGNSQNTDTIELSKDVLNNNSNVIDVLMLSGIFESKSETKRLIEQNGVSINGEKVKSIDMIITEDMLEDNALLIQKGKKKFIKMLFV
ncbi:MAG: tyrosine--tRNA ligase [Firmicutes bacterium]|jgi:tyrosine--tRNA ligase|uniref:tyrosine--tRNA ligase n=1 Tax=Candidatus Onthocola sp. TaxID=3085646 RepID=UPI002420E8F1|nr:tyrosine--tRNA ligase [Bacillota bacterium]